MGFNKRWVNKNLLIDKYRRGGLIGVKGFLGSSDALICEDTLSIKVTDILGSDEISDIEKWDSVSRLIYDESIELGFGKEKSS
tara:strand:+ start:3678 stop:3926 length:249 start_codon:yes stop_codon:yes gene_type:complete